MDELSREEVEAERDLYGPFTESLRGLVDAAIRTTVPEDEIRRAHAEIEAITERLRSAPMRTTYGVDLRTDGRGRAWGNAVVGLRNAIAPPLTIVQEGRGVRSSFTLGAAYEGPPGSVHGGVLALVLDQMLGEAAGAGGKPGMTATLTLTYQQRTAARRPHQRGLDRAVRGHQDLGPRRDPRPRTVSRSRPRGCSSCRGGRARRSRTATRARPSPRFFE